MAVGLADRLIHQFSAEVTLIPSTGGVYEVVVNGTLVYSKKQTGEFPNERQLLKSIAALPL